MFVLQDCSICFEDYDAQRIPHSISCGHVFCRPCLDSLVSSSPNCPNCRASIGRKAIRKVVCGLQDPPALDASKLSEAEMIMWQAIESAAESTDEDKQRRSLTINNSKLAVRKAGFSKNVLVALDVMRLLVEVESVNKELNQNMDSARAVEESLRDQISFLEAQLSGTRAGLSANIRDFQTLLSKMLQLESSIWTSDKFTSQTTHQLTTTDSLPAPAVPHMLPPDHIRTKFSQGQTQSPPQPNPKAPKNSFSAVSQLPRLPVLPATPVDFVSPPSPTTVRPYYQADTSRTPNPSELSLTRSLSGGIQVQSSSASFQPKPKSWAELAKKNPQAWGSQRGDQRGISSPADPQPSSSTRTLIQQTIIAVYGHTANNDCELSLTAGETIDYVHESTIFDGHKWVLCSARGEAGYVPEHCLNVTIEI